MLSKATMHGLCEEDWEYADYMEGVIKERKLDLLEKNMPIYVYSCDNCGNAKDAVKKVDERNGKEVCDKCGSEMRRVISKSGFKIK